MNSYAVSLTAEQQSNFPGIGANNLRSAWLDDAFWDGGSNPPGGTNAANFVYFDGHAESLRMGEVDGINLAWPPGVFVYDRRAVIER